MLGEVVSTAPSTTQAYSTELRLTELVRRATHVKRPRQSLALGRIDRTKISSSSTRQAATLSVAHSPSLPERST